MKKKYIFFNHQSTSLNTSKNCVLSEWLHFFNCMRRAWFNRLYYSSSSSFRTCVQMYIWFTNGKKSVQLKYLHWCCLYVFGTYFWKHRNVHRSYACHGNSSPIFQLWWFFSYNKLCGNRSCNEHLYAAKIYIL